MSEIHNLTRTEANEKIKDLAEKADICLFTTNLGKLPLTTRPMSTRAVDDDGIIWFFSREGSNKNQEIERDNRVQLFYSNTGSQEYMTLYGTATIMKDEAKAKELWSAIAKTWFNEGVNDPELTIIRFDPTDGHYWDTKDGKIVSLFKMVAGAISGKELETGVEGSLK
jgi:general stress protein 26